MGSKDMANFYKKSIKYFYTPRHLLVLKCKSQVALYTPSVLLGSQIFGLTFCGRCYIVTATQRQENIPT